MEKCRSCENWCGGRGNKACLRCEIYKAIKIQSAKRKTIMYDTYPDEILEAFPDVQDESPLVNYLRSIPDINGAVLVLRYYLGLSVSEAARMLHVSPDTVKRLAREAKRSAKRVP